MGGRIQHVNYRANDAEGYIAEVTYDGQAVFPDVVAAPVAHAIARPVVAHAVTRPVVATVARPGDDASRAKRMTALGLRLDEAVGVPRVQAYRAMVLRVGRDREHDLRHAHQALVERLLALALSRQNSLALAAEITAEGG